MKMFYSFLVLVIAAAIYFADSAIDGLFRFQARLFEKEIEAAVAKAKEECSKPDKQTVQTQIPTVHTLPIPVENHQ